MTQDLSRAKGKVDQERKGWEIKRIGVWVCLRLITLGILRKFQLKGYLLVVYSSARSPIGVSQIVS